MNTGSRKGQPLFVLAGMLTGWIALRITVPIGTIIDVPVPPNVTQRVGEPNAAVRPLPIVEAPPMEQETPAERAARAPFPARPSAPVPARIVPPAPHRAMPPAAQRRATDGVTAPVVFAVPPLRELPFSPVPAAEAEGRWSADGWLLWRRDGAGAASTAGAASYGGSQAGAVLRYRLSADGPARLRAHLRATGALESDENEVAAGIGLSPLSRIPLEVLAEGRVGDVSGDTRVRPAVLAVYGPPPQTLPIGLTGEVYAQAGYVGGRNATAFLDGQMRVTRSVDLASIRVQAGGGIWGGAQAGVERIDVGPTIAAFAPLGGGVFGRAALDWRERIAGGAEPGSGPVLTLSAGF